MLKTRMSFHGIISKLEIQGNDEILPGRVFMSQRRDLEGLPPVSQRKSRRGTIFLESKSLPPAEEPASATVKSKKTIDKFISFLKKHDKDFNTGKAILRKLSQNAFFHDYKQLLEEKLDPEGSIYLCQKINLETFFPNETIYREGDKVDGKLYLVYDGEVEALHPNELEHDIIKLPEKRKQSSFFTQIRALNTENEKEIRPAPSQVTKLIKKEDYFGQEVMNGKNQRECTALAKTKVHLLVIRSSDLEYVKYRFEKERVQRFNFLEQNLGLTFCTSGQRNNFFNYLIEKNLSFGEEITREGDAGTSMYFVCKGKCEVQKKSKENHITEYLISPKNKTNFRKNVNLGGVEMGSFIGEELIFGTSSKYDYTVRVSSKAILFEIKLAWFAKIFEKEIVDKIQERYLQKAKKHQEIFDHALKEINKSSAENSMTPTSSSNRVLLDCDRSHFKRFHHQTLSATRVKTVEDEENLNTPRSIRENKNSGKNSGYDVDAWGNITNSFYKKNSDEFNEDSNSSLTAESPMGRNSVNIQNPEELFENKRLFMGNIAKKSKFQIASDRNSLNQPEELSITKLESSESPRKKRVKLLRKQFKLFPQLSLQTYLNMYKEGNVKKWSWSEIECNKPKVTTIVNFPLIKDKMLSKKK